MPRDLTVRVRADIGPYQKAMSAAAASTDKFAQSGLRLQKVGMSISNLGDSLTRKVTLPLGLVGAAAIKMASDFDASFVRMQTLAGVSAGEVDNLKESVLDLAGETGKAPQELADALYFLQSSGLDSAQAMDALEVSAKASAVGLGRTEEVANAVSSAMLAYAESGLTAAEATDVLIATAREGKAEPAELASQMGRLLPIASELGITFGDVGGAIAALSTKGNNAEMATTQLVNVMSKLLKPSQQAAKMLDEVGLSSEGVRQLIAERGLLGTLEELRARLGESGFVKYMEDTQAVQGALGLLGGDLEKTKGIIEAVNDSAGSTENAFSKWAESMGAQNAQAFANFQVALIRVGEVLAPIASDVLSFVAQIAEAFSNLPGPVQTAIIAFAGFAAALGPIMSVGGRLITTVGTLMRLLSNFALPAGTITGAFNGTTVAASGLTRAMGTAGVAGALIAVASGFALFMRAKNEANFAQAAEDFAKLEEVTRKNVAATGLLNDAVKVSTTDFTASASAQRQFAESGKLSEQSLRDLDDGFASVLEKAPALAEKYIENAAAAGVSAEKIREWRDVLRDKIGADAEAAGAQEEYNAAVEEAAGVTQSATEAAQEYLDTIRGMFDPQFAMIDALQQSTAAQTELRDATTALNEARAGGDVDAIAEAETRFAEAVGGARSSVVDLHGAAVTLKASMAESGATADQVASQFIDLAMQQGFTRDEALVMAHAFGIATGAADTLGATDPTVAVKETGTKTTQDRLHRTRDAAHSIPTSRNTRVSATDSATGVLDRVRNALFGIPTSRTVYINVVGAAAAANALARARQHGGPVRAGEAYVVGEAGPELLVMGGQPGTIVPNDALNFNTPHGTIGSGSGGGGGGGTTVVNVHVAGSVLTEGKLIEAINRGLDRGHRLGKNGRSR
jgi:TP901 family phage tail tape measure protein